jgi:hypothetical protein
MTAGKIERSELIAIGGGLLMALGLFLPWYHLQNPNVSVGSHTPAGAAGLDLTGWEVHTTIRWLILAAAAAPLILSYIILRGHALSWPRGEMTAVVAVAALGIIGYVAFVNKPGTVSSLVSLKYGVFVSLLGSLLMLGGSASRASSTERPRKPPGVL